MRYSVHSLDPDNVSRWTHIKLRLAGEYLAQLTRFMSVAELELASIKNQWQPNPHIDHNEDFIDVGSMMDDACTNTFNDYGAASYDPSADPRMARLQSEAMSLARTTINSQYRLEP